MDNTSILFHNLGIRLPHVGRAFSVFGFEIAYYGVIIAVGMVLGVLLIAHIAQKTGQDSDRYMDLCTITIILSVIGARLYYVVFSWEDYRGHLMEIFDIRGGGLAIYGGVLAGMLTVACYAHIKKLPFGRLADTIGPGLLVGQILGRWGNFFNREAFGGYTNGLLAMALPQNAVRSAEITETMRQNMLTVDGVSFVQVHPTFLYESLWNTAVLVLLLYLTKRKMKGGLFDGAVFSVYLLGYGLGRCWIEGLRTDQLLLPVVHLPVSQLLSMLLICVSTAILLTGMSRKRKKSEKQNNSQK